jgi:putative SOS response-associated peptidase YedK
MSGRYFLTVTREEVETHFGVTISHEFPARYNIAPTQPVGIIRQHPHVREPRREFALARWGFIPGWSTDGKIAASRPMVHARAESVHEKMSFKSAFRRRRCLIPANGFYEWRQEGNIRQPYRVATEDLGLIALAGIWEHWLSEDGSEIETVATITRPAGVVVENIHERELLIIPKEGFDEWLHADELDFATYSKYLKAPYPDWRVHKVSTAVNSNRAEGPDLIEPNEGQLRLL